MRKYYKSIFFTKVPINGYYKYKDYFQIYPLNEEIKFAKHFPNVIEYWIEEDEIIQTPEILSSFNDYFDNTIIGSIVKLENILNLFSMFTNNSFFIYRDLEGFWGISINSNEINGLNNTPNYYIPFPFFKNFKTNEQIQSFSIMSINSIKKIDKNLYYLFDPNLDIRRKDELVLPDVIDQLFDSYFSLNQTHKVIIDNAIAFSVSSFELRSKKVTLSLLAAFTSLETMVNLENSNFKAEKCESCGQDKNKIAFKFKNFLLKYIGDVEYNKKKFNRFYSLRSKIVHIGEMSPTENSFNDLSLEELKKDIQNNFEILILGKLAIVNWLIKNNSIT